MQKTYFRVSVSAALLAVCALVSTGRADVTVQEQSTFDLSIIKAHSETTELVTADKERRDTTMHCEGFMSLLCGNAQTGEIIRLDRDVEWRLEPKKQEYREMPFLTPAQRLAAEQEARANLEKLQQCPASKQTAPGPDTQKCKLSPPKFDLVQTDTHAMLVGHDARLTQLTMTQSCANPDTGDSCDFQIALNAWLTQDQIAGLEDRRAFRKAYMHKLGLDEPDSLVQGDMRKFLAPYAESLKQLGGKAGSFQGYPLKTTVRIAFGGSQCAASQQQQNADSGSSSSTGTGLGSVASNLGGKLMGGLFKKKQDPQTDAATAASPLPPGMVQAASITTETQSVTQAPIASTQFEIPAGWKLITPPPPKPSKDVTCPQTN
jgi:hypothetical protein